MDCGVYHDEKEDKTILAMSNGQIVYKGSRPDRETEGLYTMLAICNKRTGKIRLIQAERWKVTPVLDKRVDIDDTTNANERINILNKQYGSKKQKRRTEQYERMKIDINSVKEQLEKTVSSEFLETFQFYFCFKIIFFCTIVFISLYLFAGFSISSYNASY